MSLDLISHSFGLTRCEKWVNFYSQEKNKNIKSKTFTRELNQKINEKNDECPRNPIRVKFKVRSLGVKCEDGTGSDIKLFRNSEFNMEFENWRDDS